MRERNAILADLRGKIAGIEKKPVLADKASTAELVQDRLDLAPGTLTEIFADGRRDAASASGFAYAMAGPLSSGGKAVVHIQLASDAQELGLLYGPGMPGAGIDPATLVLVRPSNISDALWACEECIGCRSVGAVVIELARTHRELDFKASRRLAIRAGEFGVSVFIIRFGKQREASPAGLRWHVAPASSLAKPFDDRAPGQARWAVTLERGRVGGLAPGMQGLATNSTDGIRIFERKYPINQNPSVDDQNAGRDLREAG